MIKLLPDFFIDTLDQAIDSVVVIDSDNTIILYNKAAEKLWGYSKKEAIGENVKLLVPNEIKSEHDSFVNRNRDSGENKIVGTSREVLIICKNGGQKWGSMSISKVHTHERTLYTAFIKDVTEEVLARKHLELLSLVTDRTDNAIIIIDNNWQTIYINKGFTTLFGYNESDMLGRSPISIIAPHLTSSTINFIRNSHLKGGPIKRDEILITNNGEKLWCSIMSNPILDEQEMFTHSVIILSEITNTKLHEILHQRALGAIANDEPLEFIMQCICDEIHKLSEEITPSIFKLNDENNLQLLSATASLPLEHKLLYKVHHLGFDSIIGQDATVHVKNIKQDAFWINHKDEISSLGYTGCLSSLIKGSDKNTIGIIVLYYKYNDVPTELHRTLLSILSPLCKLAIEREKQRENIRKLAYYDSLTSLPNRNLLYANAEQALHDADVNNTKLAFLFLDADRFKQLNDSFGHAAGDELLIHLANQLTSTAHRFHVVGRLSGDEFVAVVPFSNNGDLNNVVEDLRLRIAEPVLLNSNEIISTVSIGISIFPGDGKDVYTLIQRADMAMYQAKSLGRGRFAYFSHELNELAQELQTLEIELEKAIDNNGLELFYQPQVSMVDRSICGVEVLSRWEHPQLGTISPSKFIPIAEDCGLIGKLSKWAIHNACKQMSIWKENELDIPTISINLSPINFHNINLCDLIVSEIKRFNLKPSDIILELTESVLLDTNPSTMKVLMDIHNTGISFSMDDFGTGYSSLSYLQKIPLVELKLDRSFVQHLETDATSKVLSNAVLQLGKSLNINVVAEGIEKEEQYEILKNQGYSIAQGYLFSKALNATDVEKWFKKLTFDNQCEEDDTLNAI
ncbi:sensor domain-containing protein [Pseudoalteromonas sp. NGC95]|uniref:sensor domain-containing protein n=1 Tax=Pseudoalteromonas sp. NGC95 TaxID=2792051 RepID=UPI0018CE75A6|nr:EAL domain-containing protein [Pseudoalteromonas sp. NGC95]MBH0017910.1 EAL domain-containing protein [Pseudoalteromonas sp. NGC95]